ALALVARGRRVAVLTGPAEGPRGPVPYTVVEVPRFAPRELTAARGRLGPVRRWLLQWVPHAFGFKSVNAALVAWVVARPEPLWTMFHEVALPLGPGHPPAHRAAAIAHRAMAFALGRRSGRVLVSTPAWTRITGVPAARAEWFPVPANVALAEDTPRAREGRVVAHFGTYGAEIGARLREAVAVLVPALPGDVSLVLTGRGSRRFADALPEPLRGRVRATGGLPGAEVAAVLARATLALQPYPDGITTRRGSAMAALRVGTPLVTETGALSEGFWPRVPGVFLAEGEGGLARTALARLEAAAAPGLRGELRAFYARWLSIENTVRRLEGPADPRWSIEP
ncbi:MAG: hypothetical protein AAGH15_19225, partial [Myxococcota bacterium]